MGILKKIWKYVPALIILAPNFSFAASPILPDVSSGPITDINYLGKFIGPGGLVITLIEGLAGIIAVAMLIWGGVLLVTSAGDPQRVENGRKAITAAVVGLAIVISSYAIVYLFVTLLGGKIS